MRMGASTTLGAGTLAARRGSVEPLCPFIHQGGPMFDAERRYDPGAVGVGLKRTDHGEGAAVPTGERPGVQDVEHRDGGVVV